MDSSKHIVFKAALSFLMAALFCTCKPPVQLNTSFYEDKGSIPLNNSATCNCSFDYYVTSEYPVSIEPQTAAGVIDSMKVELLRQLYGPETVKLAIDGALPNSAAYADEPDITKKIINVVFDYKIAEYKRQYAKIWSTRRNTDCNRTDKVEIYNTATNKGIASFVVYHVLESGDNILEETEKGVNFRLKDGHVVKETDLFKGNKWESILQAKLREQIQQQCQPQVLESIDMEKVRPNGNFLLNKKHIIYLFDSNKLGSEEHILFRVKLPFAEINHITR